MIAALTLLAAMLPATDCVSATDELRYRSDSIALAGLLLLPPGGRPVPGAVIVQGSGPSDRTNAWARAIAEEFVCNGVAVLLTDKRGGGASGGDWRRASFEDLARDAVAGVRALRGRREILADRVGLIGLSQGGWVVPLAAARSGTVAFVVNISGAAVSFAEQSFTEMKNTARQAGLPPSAIEDVLALNRAAGAYLATGDWARFQDEREKGLRSSWREVARGFPASPDAPIWTFLRSVAAYDPMPFWLQVRGPVLVVYGADDEHDNVPVAESVRRLQFGFALVNKSDAQLTVVPGVGHSLLGTDHHLAQPFRVAVRSWVATHVAGGAGPG